MNKHDGCEGCKYEREAIESSHCIGCKQNAIDRYVMRTNADKIRSMSDEELVEFVINFEQCEVCEMLEARECGNCEHHIKNWLQSEVEE